jgi:integrase/recombinase XerD
MMELKERGLSFSRLEHHKSALKTFYAMLVKLKIVSKNIASTLPPLRKRGISICKRNYMIISMLWALGLRISELTSLTVGSFEPEHDPINKIGLLRVKGKNRKQRALFVVDKLYDNLIIPFFQLKAERPSQTTVSRKR